MDQDELCGRRPDALLDQKPNGRRRPLHPWRAAALLVGAVACLSAQAVAQEGAVPHWIWHPAADGGKSFPAETRYFRKVFNIKEPSRLALDVAADNEFSLYLDGKLIAEGNEWRTPVRAELKIETGTHVLAASASNEAPGAAGFLVGGGVLPLGQGAPVHTRTNWKSSDSVPAGDDWKTLAFDDSGWAVPVDLGELGVQPWGNLAMGLSDPAERLQTPEGFKVESVASPMVSGSAVAFTFDPNGAPCLSIERGPIVRLYDDDGDGRYDRRETITPQMNNCQGLYFHKDVLYAVGVGPEKDGLYRLTDTDGDGVFETAELIRGVNGGMGEHGPHAVALGPDGRLYYNSGNHSHMKPPIDPASPVNIAYEGELLPHFNDSRGHAAGIMAPGGEILRSDDSGASWKRMVAGFRNEYDFAFNSEGELFTFDSDMEWDIGLPWYRPVRVNHCPPGAEFGWRNGSGKWPAYYFDSLPGVLDLGRGSPTGVTFYLGDQFPEDYRDQFLICDWSQGRILAVKLEREGASYRSKATELVSGQPLNCTDIEVGPDGCVYFTIGGRGTQGGFFRVKSTREAGPAETPGDFLAAALDIDSPLSSFSQHKLAQLREANQAEWGRRLDETARDASGRSSAHHRVRALEVMSQVGPEPTEDLLIALAGDPVTEVRSRAIWLLAHHATEASRAALTAALADHDPFVKRRACEALLQQPAETIPVLALLPLLAEQDRFIRFAARTAIEHAGPERFRDALLAVDAPRAKVEAMLALVRGSQLDAAAQNNLFERQLVLLRETLDAGLQLDLLRLIQLTYLLGPQKGEAAVSDDFRQRMLAMFTESADTPVNRELARLLAFLDAPEAPAAILAHQAAAAAADNRPAQIHDAYCLRAITQGWDAAAKQSYWAWFETASHWDGGFSYLGYLDMMLHEFLPRLSDEERAALLAQGETHPFPTRVLARELDVDGKPESVALLASLYERLRGSSENPNADDLKATIVERLGRSPSEKAREALRALLAADPAGRDQFVRALAQHPAAVDLPIFAAALESTDRNMLGLALHALSSIDAAPEGPEPLVNLIRLAHRAPRPLVDPIRKLAERWFGTPGAKDFAAEVAAWEEVYKTRYPNGPSLVAEAAAEARNYDLDDLVKNVLQAEVMKSASPARGAEVLARVRCLDCHKFGDKGQGLGPDLTTVNSRFQPADILDSIVAPSKVVSDQYQTITVAVDDGRVFSGMPVVTDGPNLVLLLSDGARVTIPKDNIEEQQPSPISVMPEGLLNTLNYQEIADLIALFESVPRVEVTGQAGAAQP